MTHTRPTPGDLPRLFRARRVAFALLAAALAHALPAPAVAQDGLPDTREELRRQFEASARKLVALAEAMPAETWAWRPMDDVASVARVYMHIARYNYYYPHVALGVEPPDGLDYDRWEEEVGDKAEAVAILTRSMDHVRGVITGLSEAELAAATELYGREVASWAVLLQLVTHMNEHLGQSIAYARMNQVVPPWSG
jgi:uncharacterized damage-inducible protein DinB